MKKLHKSIAILMMLGLLFSVASCGGNGFLCKNKTTIVNGLNTVIATGIVLKTFVPEEFRTIIDLINSGIQLAQAGLAKSCPTVEDLTAAETKINEALQLAKATGMRFELSNVKR